jgi:hypothetical protein
MNRIPSIKTLREVFDDRAKEARLLLEGQLDPDSYPSVDRWNRECYHKPSYHERLLCALDELAGTFGVEAVFSDQSVQPVLEYLNAGASYAATLVYRRDLGSFKVSTWADEAGFLERKGYRFD